MAVESWAKSRGSKKRFAAKTSIASNVFLLCAKIVVGVLSGSVGIFAELVNSAADLLGAIVVYFSVRAADAPPDDSHAYGHGKIENLSGAATAMLIFIGGLAAIWTAVVRLIHPHPPGSLTLALIVMGGSSLINIVVSRVLLRIGAQEDSPALAADGHHLQTDVWTSLGVFVGLGLVYYTHQTWWDSVAAIAVSLLVLRVGYKLVQEAVRTLADEALPVNEEAILRQILQMHPSVLSYHKLRSRKSGSHRHSDVHVQIADTHTFVDAHRITEEIEDQMRDALPNMHPIIHIEPFDDEEEHQRQAHMNAKPPSP